jgi:hypothetical protein
MADNIKELPQREMTVREQAEAEVRKERAVKAVTEMKKLLRNKVEAEAVIKGIDLQIADLERQIEDGTL